MTPASRDTSRFWAVGEVVQISEWGEETRRVLVRLDLGAVIDVPFDGPGDVHLGDRVSVEGTLAVDRVGAAGESPSVVHVRAVPDLGTAVARGGPRTPREGLDQ